MSSRRQSARQLMMRAGRAEVTVHPFDGGRIGQIVVGGERLLRGPEDAAELGWGHWGCYPLLPWSNRIPDGTFRFEGRTLTVPVNSIDGSALHGLAVQAAWTAGMPSAAHVELSVDLDAGPYRVTGHQSLQLTETHLDLTLGVVNRADRRIPVGLGIHPWFRAGPIRVPAELAWPGDTPLPTGPPEPVRAERDLRSLRVAAPMDRCFTGLTESSVDVPGLRLSWTGPVTQVVVFSGVSEWVCVEPVTMANDGFRLADEGVDGSGVITLEPGAGTEVCYRFTWTG